MRPTGATTCTATTSIPAPGRSTWAAGWKWYESGFDGRSRNGWRVGLVEPADLQQDPEHEVVGAHQHERVDQVPRDAERGALVLLAQLAADELLEEVAIGHAAIMAFGAPQASRRRQARFRATTILAAGWG